MLSHASNSRTSWQKNVSLGAPAAALCGCVLKQTGVARAAAARAAAPARAPAVESGKLPDDVLDAVTRYGHHSKAAYILFYKWKGSNEAGKDGRAAADVAGKAMEEVIGASLPGLSGYTGIANMWGYACPANVLADSTPDSGASDATLLLSKEDRKAAGGQAPTYIGYIAGGPGGELVIAFRGSSVTSDWVMNLLGGVGVGGVYPPSSGKVHQGLHMMVHDHPPDDWRGRPTCTEYVTPIHVIDEAIESYKMSHNGALPKRIICTGHSLGGALATLAAAHIAQRMPEMYRQQQSDSDSSSYTQRPLQVYTMAAPRVGDEVLRDHFKQALGVTAVQLKNEQDPVPCLAPRWSELPSAIAKAVRRTERQMELNQAEHLKERYQAVLRKLAALGKLARKLARFGRQPPAAAAPAVPAVTAAAAAASAAPAVTAAAAAAAGEEEPDATAAAAAAAEDEKAEAMSWMESARYLWALGHTSSTHWVDNAAPDFGITTFSSSAGGLYGGAMHSIEVYLDNIPKPHQGASKK